MAILNGTAGNDNISGTTANDTINGFGGNDFLAGGSGNDSVAGGTGNDTVYGDGGNDWIEGGAGNDNLSGGGGQDDIVFREFGAANADTVGSFDTNWDRIQLDAAAFATEPGEGGPTLPTGWNVLPLVVTDRAMRRWLLAFRLLHAARAADIRLHRANDTIAQPWRWCTRSTRLNSVSKASRRRRRCSRRSGCRSSTARPS